NEGSWAGRSRGVKVSAGGGHGQYPLRRLRSARAADTESLRLAERPVPGVQARAAELQHSRLPLSVLSPGRRYLRRGRRTSRSAANASRLQVLDEAVGL